MFGRNIKVLHLPASFTR